MKTDLKDPFFTTQIMTCIGNKRKLLSHIDKMIQYVKLATNKDALISADLFCGSGIVTRLLAKNSYQVYINDLESYAQCVAHYHLDKCENIRQEDWDYVINLIDNYQPQKHFFLNNYAPKDENNITKNDRVFFTRRNADYIDKVVEFLPTYFGSDNPPLRQAIIGRLIEETSVHCNTNGVFKGFLKDKKTGIGKYGGTNKDCLDRIKGDIVLTYPVLLDKKDFIYTASCLNVNDENLINVVNSIQPDLVYLDPPYNQHPYGSNYFMLNLIADYDNLDLDNLESSKVSGIPKSWKHSKYNNQRFALEELEDLIKKLDSKFILLSYNNQGFISYEDIVTTLSRYGRLIIKDINYIAYRGGRKTEQKKKKTKEYLFLLEKEKNYDLLY